MILELLISKETQALISSFLHIKLICSLSSVRLDDLKSQLPGTTLSSWLKDLRQSMIRILLTET